VWDNPRRLNIVAGALVGVALLCFGAVGLSMLLRSPLFPVLELHIVSPMQNTTREEIEAAAQGRISGNFFFVDLGELRLGIERLPWIRRASLRRVWPGTIEVRLEEHVALARWSDRELVNVHGERYRASSEAPLPQFLAPSGFERELSQRYRRFVEILQPLEAKLDRVVLTPRFAWELRLANGLTLMLGRDADLAEQRLRRFVQVYDSTLKKIALSHEYVDLRYPNGFALRVPELKS
jgi:cell division protein FtsQ